MKQEDKELLFKDLCGRLPYGVKVHEVIQGNFTLIGLIDDRVLTSCEVENRHNNFPIEIIKPCLYPLSSMTEEQNLEYLRTCKGGNASVPTLASFEWLNKNHFDYRGLIEKGLAIDCTNLNIY